MAARSAGAGAALLDLYAPALPQVYGYLLPRCSDRAVAEDLTSETFLAAADAARRPSPLPMDVGWLIGVARHKLADLLGRTLHATEALLVRARREFRTVYTSHEGEGGTDA